MDKLTYQYETVANGYTKNINKLRSVDDDPSADPTDIYKTDLNDQNNDNYTYDAIGNLTSDASEEIAEIKWTVYGKVKEVIREAGSAKSDLEFLYDANGNRIAKIEKTKDISGTIKPNSDWIAAFYVRDAGGNIMATYLKKETGNDLFLDDQVLYGSSRIGVLKRDLNLSKPPLQLSTIFTRTLGNKQFEGGNHLGNVLVTFSDRKIPKDNNSDNVIDFYAADVTSMNDYGVWGDPLPQRNFNSTESRFGFNGKLKINEINGENNFYEYGMRDYDPRIGKFPSVDPIGFFFPFYSPNQYAGNSPIMNIDMDGLEPVQVVHYSEAEGVYKLNEPVIHLLHITTGVSEDLLREVKIFEGIPGLPYYDPNEGGGGITFGKAIRLTKNYFEKTPNVLEFQDALGTIKNTSYGRDVMEWLRILAHEAGHLPQADMFRGPWSVYPYILAHGGGYLMGGIITLITGNITMHDNSPLEEIPIKQSVFFMRFYEFINISSDNEMFRLLNSKISDEQKMQRMDFFFKDFLKNNPGSSLNQPSSPMFNPTR